MEINPTTVFAGMSAVAVLILSCTKAVAEFRQWKRPPPASHRPRRIKPRSR